ncbi:MAG: rhodanese-like domain-containing protein [Candidatus Fonsibacter sp.]
MIKQIPSKDLEKFIKENPSSILLDVRTEEEWNMVGKPSGKKFKIKTYFISLLKGVQRIKNDNFVHDVNSKKISKEDPILVICRSGQRSQMAATLLQQEGYKNCINISDGFEGNVNVGLGWKNSNLPVE